MVDFTRRRKFVTRGPALTVDAGLAPGSHLFELVVMDQAGNRSQPARIKVTVVRNRFTYLPGAVVTRPPLWAGGGFTPSLRPNRGGGRGRPRNR